MDTGVKEFIEKHIDLIEAGDFKTLYQKTTPGTYFGEITKELLSAGIDPLENSDIVYPRMFDGYTRFGTFDVPEGIKTLGERAFQDSLFSSVSLPESLVRIGVNCFRRSKIKKVVFSYNCNLEIVYAQAFYEAPNLTNIVLPRRCKYVQMMAFASSGLQDVLLPDNVEFIGSGAFMHTPLKNIRIPRNIAHVGTNIFSGCDNLQHIYVPEDVIKKNAFWNKAKIEFLEGNNAEIVVV